MAQQPAPAPPASGSGRRSRRRKTRAARPAHARAQAATSARIAADARAAALSHRETISISKAGGAFPIDWVRANADARETLNAIDFSQRDLVIWVPGSGSGDKVHPKFEDAVRSAWSDGRVSLARMRYSATWNIRPSVATGIATLKLVLAGIAAHGGNHRVLVAGESQGAWAIGEAIADPRLRRVVDRAVLFGHPWLGRHEYASGQDSGVRVYNHANDLVTLKFNGDPGRGLDAMSAVFTVKLWKLPLVIRAMAENPKHGLMLLSTIQYALPWKSSQSPHNYGKHMVEGVAFLRAAR